MFTKSVESIDNILKLAFTGFINETVSFGSYDFTKYKTIIIDCSGVEMINSTGVLYWVHWFAEAQNKNGALEFYFIKCPKIIINQMNIVSHFLPRNAIVQSVIAPFWCEKCGAQKAVTLNHDEHYQINAKKDDVHLSLPDVPCEKCKTQMQTDFIPKYFFQFLK